MKKKAFKAYWTLMLGDDALVATWEIIPPFVVSFNIGYGFAIFRVPSHSPSFGLELILPSFGQPAYVFASYSFFNLSLLLREPYSVATPSIPHCHA